MTMTMTTQTEDDSNVIPFKNIGVFIENLTGFAGKHGGLVGLRQEGPEQWFATITFKKENRSMECEGDTFNSAVLNLWRTANRQFGKAV